MPLCVHVVAHVPRHMSKPFRTRNLCWCRRCVSVWSKPAAPCSVQPATLGLMWIQGPISRQPIPQVAIPRLNKHTVQPQHRTKSLCPHSETQYLGSLCDVHREQSKFRANCRWLEAMFPSCPCLLRLVLLYVVLSRLRGSGIAGIGEAGLRFRMQLPSLC